MTSNNNEGISKEECMEIVDKIYTIIVKANLATLDALSVSLNFYLNICRDYMRYMKSKNVPNEKILFFLDEIATNNAKALDALKKSLKEEGIIND